MYFWSFMGSAAAVGMEWLYLRTPSYTAYWPVTLPLAVFVNYCIFRLMQHSGSIMVSVIVFSFSNILLRTLLTLVTRQRVTWQTWAAFSLIAVANLVRLWR